jgi:nitroimidazol reductase NimA-like FMN-containing flavoprotein (pyridoxamine 5'-phosphate oxidase superfamily)
MTEKERQAFLAEPRVGVLSVASDNGRPPLTVPIWYSYQPGGDVTFFTGTFGMRARKTALIHRAGVVSLSVQHGQMPYRYVTIEGSVVGTDQPPSKEQILAITRRYLPEDHAQGFARMALEQSGPDFVHFTIRPDRWITSDFSEDGG